MHWAAVGGTQKPYYVSTEQQPRVQLFQELHYMYCHPSDTSFKAALSHGSILGTPLVPADVNLARLVLGPCPQCLAGKSINPSYTSSPTMPAGRIGSRVFMDLVPLAGTTIGGNNHVLLYLDAYSGYLGVCGVDSKRSQSVINALDVIVSAFEVGSHRIEEIVTDSEICFVAIRPHLMSVIRSRRLLTPPKQHNQRIERYVRVINDRMRSVLAGLTYVLPTKLYGELMATVVFFMNMFPNKVHPTLTPAIVFNGDKMDCRQVNHVPFGSAVMVLETDKTPGVSKYAERAELALVLGPSTMVRSSVHVYVHSTKTIKTRNRYVIIPMAPRDFGFEPKSGTVLSSIPDFISYDPSLRALPSPTEFDQELPAHAGDRARRAEREAAKRSLEAFKIRNSFRHGNMPRILLGKDNRDTLAIERLPPLLPGFPTYAEEEEQPEPSFDEEAGDSNHQERLQQAPTTGAFEPSIPMEAGDSNHQERLQHAPTTGAFEPSDITEAGDSNHQVRLHHTPTLGVSETSVSGAIETTVSRNSLKRSRRGSLRS